MGDDTWLAKAREKLATREVVTVARSKVLREEATASGVIHDLEEAILASRSVGVKEAELEDINKVLAERRREAGVPEVQSSFFTEKANTGAKDGLLFRRLCFHGENRCVHALVFNITHKDWTNITRAHAYFGVRVYIHKIGEEQKMPNLKTILQKPARTTIWIVSSDGKVRDGLASPMNKEHVEQITQFYYDGGGLALWGAHDPFVHEANLVLDELGINAISGKFVGNETLSQAPADPATCFGFNAGHPICHGIRKVFAGPEDASRIPESLVRNRGWTEILRSNENSYTTKTMSPCQTKEITTVTKLSGGRGALLMVLLEAFDGYGPLLINSRLSMLFEMDGPGVKVLLHHLGAYMMLRPRDMTGCIRNEVATEKATLQHRKTIQELRSHTLSLEELGYS